jgi:hypothetical protein
VRFAEAGVPAVALVTEKFWSQGDYVAKVAGMPDLPRVQLPHPVAGRTNDEMEAIAESIADAVLAGMRGR